MSRRTSCSPSSRGRARRGQRRSETAANELDVWRPPRKKMRSTAASPSLPRYSLQQDEEDDDSELLPHFDLLCGFSSSGDATSSSG